MATVKIERGRLKAPLAKAVQDIMIAPTLTHEEVTRAYQFYLDVNKAHVLMLAKQNIIEPAVAKAILQTTQQMAQMGDCPSFAITPELEEMYFNLENYLIGQVGIEIGGQQHTARSRNDLHATVDRMLARKSLLDMLEHLNGLRSDLLHLADQHFDSVMSGYTHLQPSEPISFAHYLSAVSFALTRDFQRLLNSWERTNLNPLGGGSMGSSTWPIDRDMTTKLLGFDGLVENSLDAVASRDYLLEIMCAISLLSNTLVRMSTDMRLWCAPEYGYLEVADEVAVCSSIMPQKKNPWTFETIASMCARVKGHTDAAWMTYKGVPYAFTMESMDLISNYWPAMKDMTDILTLMTVTMRGIQFKKQRAYQWAKENFSTVTEIANTLVRSNHLSFRVAHEIVAHAVAELSSKGLNSSAITLDLLKKLTSEVTSTPLTITNNEIVTALDPQKNVCSKVCKGGTAPQELTRQLTILKNSLKADKTKIEILKEKINIAKQKMEMAVETVLKI